MTDARHQQPLDSGRRVLSWERRGSRRGDGTAVHLLAAALYDTQTVIAQRQVAAKSNKIPAFAPLVEGLDLRWKVVTADAMHTQHEHARHLAQDPGAHYTLIVKGNQNKLHRQLNHLLATLRNLAHGLTHLIGGWNNIAATNDHYRANPDHTIHLLDLT